MSPKHRLLALPLSLALGTAAIPGIAQAAAADYEAITRVTLTLNSVNGIMSIPTGLVVNMSASVSSQYEFTMANGTAKSEATLEPMEFLTPMEIGAQLIQYTQSLGQVVHREGYGESGIQTEGVISIVNQGTESAELRFTYDLYAAVVALIEGDGITAGAESDWIIGDEASQVSIAGGIYADAVSNVHPINWIESDDFTLTVAAGDSAALWALVGARGLAEAPEPPPWALFCVGLCLAATFHASTAGPRPRMAGH